MRISLSKLWPVVRAIYDAFLKGRKVGDFTLPSQGNTIGTTAPGQTPLDSTPHKPAPPPLQ